MNEKLEQMIEDLREAAALDGTENGEWWARLADMADAIEYGASNKFIAAWKAEVKAEHKRLKQDFQVTKFEQTIKQVVKRLDHIGD